MTRVDLVRFRREASEARRAAPLPSGDGAVFAKVAQGLPRAPGPLTSMPGSTTVRRPSLFVPPLGRSRWPCLGPRWASMTDARPPASRWANTVTHPPIPSGSFAPMTDWLRPARWRYRVGRLNAGANGCGLVRMRLDAGQIFESWLTVVGYDRRPCSPTWLRRSRVVGEGHGRRRAHEA